MKFQLERDVFNEAVAWAMRSISARTAMPILQGIRIVSDQNTLTFTSFDYEVSALITVEADIEEPGEILVQGKMLQDITAALPHSMVSVSLEGTKVQIRCGSSRFSLSTLPVEEYPLLPQMPEVIGDVDAQAFARAINQVVIAASKEEVVPLLTAVKVSIEGDKMTLAATDRYRLAMRELTWNPKQEGEFSALVRHRVLTDLAKSLTPGKLDLALSNEGAHLVGFEAGGRRTTSTLVDGEYPPVQRLFPDVTPYTAVVKTSELIDALRRVKLVTDRNAPVRINFLENGLRLDAGATEDAQATEAIEAQVEGGELIVGYNPSYLLDGLSALGSEYAHFSIPDAVKPTVLRGIEEPTAEVTDTYRYLLMPQRL